MRLNADTIHTRLERIEKMQGSDPGFALLAVLSFIEAFIREALEEFSSAQSMPDLLERFGKMRNGERNYRLQQDGFARELLHYQKLANTVRHHFSEITQEEFQGALYRLFDFLDGLKIQDESVKKRLKRLEDSLKVWKGHRSHYDDFSELLETGFRLARSMQKTRELEKQLERQSLSAESLEYVHAMQRISSYSRSRRAFERRLIEPSPEQEQVLTRIRNDRDFLITGAAGTGKTLVLIMAVEQYVRSLSGELDLGQFNGGPLPVTLLTYTSTLAKYNKYLASLLKYPRLQLFIRTVDSFLNREVEQWLPGRNIVYNSREYGALFRRVYNPACAVEPERCLDEIEQYIFAHNISREIYIDEGIVRKGREFSLSEEQRRAIWTIRDGFASLMEDERMYTRNYARVRLVEQLEGARERGLSTDEGGRIFVDEIQDLNRVDLQALKLLSPGGIVMAGDREQSIFLGGFSFKASGVSVQRGGSAILKQNFRNSREIHRIASLLRDDPNTDEQAVVLRHGPPVELFSNGDYQTLLSRLGERCSFAMDYLSYSPENLCVAAPSSRDLKAVQQMLQQRGIDSVSIKDRNFSFAQSGGIRLSTLHSIKGLDFAGVLVFIPTGIWTGKEDDPKLKQNLLYVASTRAMELLWFFTSDHPDTRKLNLLYAELEKDYPSSQD